MCSKKWITLLFCEKIPLTVRIDLKTTILSYDDPLPDLIYIAFNSGCKWINNRVYIQSRLDSGQPKSRNAFWCWRIFDRKIRRLTSNHLFHLVLIPRQVKLCIHCLLFFLYVKTFHLKGLNFAISTDSSEMWQKYFW